MAVDLLLFEDYHSCFQTNPIPSVAEIRPNVNNTSVLSVVPVVGGLDTGGLAGGVATGGGWGLAGGTVQSASVAQSSGPTPDTATQPLDKQAK